MGCGLDFNSVSAHLPSRFSKVLQKRDFLDINLTTVFGVGNCQNTSALTVMFFFFENFQNVVYMWDFQKKIEANFFFLKIIAYVLAALNCLY